MIEYTVKVYAKGTKEWYLNGKLHREDGPAVEWTDGTNEWWLNGKRHREDGPAVEYTNGAKEWWLNGGYLTEQEFNDRQINRNGKEVVIDGKTYILALKIRTNK